MSRRKLQWEAAMGGACAHPGSVTGSPGSTSRRAASAALDSALCTVLTCEGISVLGIVASSALAAAHTAASALTSSSSLLSAGGASEGLSCCPSSSMVDAMRMGLWGSKRLSLIHI